MSSLNNKYGVSNGCPAFMNDGRGVNTEFRSNRLLTQELRKNLGSKSTHEFRTQLQKIATPNVKDVVADLMCSSVPDGEVVIDKEIRIGQSSTPGSVKDGNLNPIDLSQRQYHTYNF